MSSPLSSSTIIKSSPSSGDFIGVGQHYTMSKRSRSGRNRTLIIALVVALAYLSGVITGILCILSMTATTSVQRDTTTSGLRILSSSSLLTPPTTMSSTSTSSSSTSESSMLKMIIEENQRLREEQKQQQKIQQELQQQVRQLKQQQQQQQQQQKVKKESVTMDKELPLFPETVKQMVVDYATVPRDDFNQILDVGVPYDDTKDKKGVGGEEVLLLYTTPAAVPAVHSKTNKFGLNATEAMENCNVVKVILHRRHDHRQKHVRQCIALVPNWDSYYVHNFQRLPPQVSTINIPGERLLPPGKPVNATYPLRYTSRNHDDDGLTYELVPRTDWYTRPYYRVLSQYLQNLDRVLEKVQSFIKKHVIMHDKTTTMNKKQTLVVMTVNKGQSVLFHNFVCHARKNGIDLSHVIMFATDETAQQLCQDLGIPAFYDETIYGDFPEESANGYGDSTFGKMMLAKVICVHLILYSGYNVLFQDVDVIWFKNPLDFLQSPKLEEWDMIFQDDGSRQPRFRPYSANSGFYFVRNNEITRFFFSTLLRLGDVVMSDHSHQSAMVSLLNEFASWKGLRVKVFRHGLGNPFPGGVEFHRPNLWNVFRNMFQHNVYPWIYHMSWTFNMDDKIKHYQQLGMWYLPNSTNACSGLDCCQEEANFVCHYGERPSMRPCPGAPIPERYKGPKFWP